MAGPTDIVNGEPLGRWADATAERAGHERHERHERHEPGFEVRVRTDIGGQAHELVPRVDGVEPSALVTVYENAHGMDPAGGYAGVIVEHFDFGDLGRYLEGRPTSAYWADLGRIALLGCECGEVGCWPLYATVERRPDGSVSWSGFVQPHRKQRDYAGLGPFVFDADSYRSAVAAAIAGIEAKSYPSEPAEPNA